MKFLQLGFIFQSCDRLAKFWLDSENQSKFFLDIQKKSLKSKIGTQNSVKLMPKIEEWCSWVKIFILLQPIFLTCLLLVDLSSKVRQDSWWPVAKISKSTSNNLTCLPKKDKSSCENISLSLILKQSKHLCNPWAPWRKGIKRV